MSRDGGARPLRWLSALVFFALGKSFSYTGGTSICSAWCGSGRRPNPRQSPSSWRRAARPLYSARTASLLWCLATPFLQHTKQASQQTTQNRVNNQADTLVNKDFVNPNKTYVIETWNVDTKQSQQNSLQVPPFQKQATPQQTQGHLSPRLKLKDFMKLGHDEPVLAISCHQSSVSTTSRTLNIGAQLISRWSRLEYWKQKTGGYKNATEHLQRPFQSMFSFPYDYRNSWFSSLLKRTPHKRQTHQKVQSRAEIKYIWSGRTDLPVDDPVEEPDTQEFGP